ncbi:hypothetical protein MY10362_002608 [Beauveria mimosiformis]
MLALSLLLSVAAGVNAIYGGNISSVRVTDTSFFCTEDCTFRGVYFSRLGYYCPENEVVARLDAKGNLSIFPFNCSGMEKKTESRQPASGEKPPECSFSPRRSLESCPFLTEPETISRARYAEDVKWSDIEKELKAAAPPNAAAPPKSKQECDVEGGNIFRKCQEEGGSFDECHETTSAAIRSCQGLE